jgi:chemotaxis response regulator CheB
MREKGSTLQEEDQAREPDLTIRGIGASAGGLADLKDLFKHVPTDSGLAFVVVVHLSPNHKSHLADLLQARFHMPILQVTETSFFGDPHVFDFSEEKVMKRSRPRRRSYSR